MPLSPQDPESHEGLDEYAAGWNATMRMVKEGRSFSGHERNCVFLNCGRPRFANVSAATGLDYADDGRAMSVVDWDHDGDLDLWIHNRTGPRLRLMLNQTHSGAGGSDFIAFKLEGTACNRDAIGARVEVRLADDSAGPLIQTLYAGDGFLSQSSRWMHFGLGREPVIEQVVVHWPGGESEQFADVVAGHRYVLVQGRGEASEGGPPQRRVQLAPSVQTAAESTQVARTFLPAPFPPPKLRYHPFEDSSTRLVQTQGKPLLVSLWASWCPSCIAELREFTKHQHDLDTAGLRVLALSVDGLGEDKNTQPNDAKRLLARIKFPFDAGVATAELLDKIQILDEFLYAKFPSFAVPMSLLFNSEGRLTVIYRGPMGMEVLLKDVTNIQASREQQRKSSVPFPGRYQTWPEGVNLESVASFFKDRYAEDYIGYLELEIEGLEASRVQARRSEDNLKRLNDQVFEDHTKVGLALEAQGMLAEAISHYREAVRIAPGSAVAHVRLGTALTSHGKLDEAIEQYRQAIEAEPDLANAHYNLGNVLIARGRLTEALGSFREANRLTPDWSAPMNGLAWVLATHPDPAVREPDEAIRLAERASELTPNPSAPTLDTLAAAYAAAGQFDRAVKTAESAITFISGPQAEELANQIRPRLELYKQGQPYVSPAR